MILCIATVQWREGGKVCNNPERWLSILVYAVIKFNKKILMVQYMKLWDILSSK